MLEQGARDRLEQIEESLRAIQLYQEPIKSGEDFYTSEGSLRYDAILMRLQVLGENIKSIYKSNPEILEDVDMEVVSIIRFRDLISHHYEKLDTEIVYDICTQYIPTLHTKFKELLQQHR